MEIKKVSFSYNQEPYVQDLSLSISKGKLTTIIGANGSGKSTLLMLLGHIYKVQKGQIVLDNKNIDDYKLKEFARNVAIVHQKNELSSDLGVRTIVGHGRLPYLNYYQNLGSKDNEIIDWAIEITGLKSIENELLRNLSGGQQQKVWLAMTLAQKTPYLLLDEPTTYLDIKAQIEILNLIKTINKEYHITVIMVHHDINQAIYYSDEIIAMKKGKILYQGKPQEVIYQQSLKEIYDYDLKIIKDDTHMFILNYEDSMR